MKSSASSTVAAILVAATVLSFSILASAKDSWWNYTHVHIINGFEEHHYPLMVHCKSKDDDMGIHWVGPHGEYEWRFKPKITGNTLFWCQVEKHGKEIVFDAYWEDDKTYNRKYMDHVRWVAKDDGIYLRQFWKPNGGVDVFWKAWPQ